jgi:hypothetical protein
MMMHAYRSIFCGLAALALGAAAAPAQAEILVFQTKLDGKYGDDATGSAATGTARIRVDTERRRVSVDLTVDGITVDALWDKLVSAPVGPVHFHKYATPTSKDSVLVLPVPYGADYRPTERGLRVTMNDYDYVAGARLLGSTLSFDEFVSAMQSGLVILNVHTDKHNPGEISGRVETG